ncbi:MAG: hypothetical protein U9R42_08875 [Bacteroidota bacterium]|nr:hypothetical protein [Bacteroidota bacterium]
MKKVLKIQHRFIILLLIIPLIGFSQEDDNDKKIFNKNYDVFTTYKPEITDAIKLDVIPFNERIVADKPQIKYRIKLKQLVPKKEFEKLPAISIIRRQSKHLSHYYLKAGVGNFANVLADFNYNTTKSRDKIFAIHLKHNSGKSTPKNSNISEQLLNVSGKKLFRKNILESNVFFNNDILHFYGYDHVTDTFNSDSIKQDFMRFGMNASFNNEISQKENFNYWANTGVYYLMDYYDASELGFKIGGALEQHFRETPIRFEAKFQQFSYKSDKIFNRNVLDIIAKFNLNKDWFRAKIGFDVAAENNSSKSKIHFYPDLKIEAELLENYITAYAEFTGGLKVNSFNTITKENPYVLSQIDLKNTNYKLVLAGGLKGSFSQNIDYFLRLSYNNIENLMMFVNDTTDSKRFKTIYDTGNTILFKANAEVSAKLHQNLDVFLNAEYYNYDLSQELFAWHLPDYKITLSGKYNFDKKVYVKLDFFTIGDRKAKAWDESGQVETIDLDAIYDMNASVTYQFSKKFGIFFNFNNIFSNKYSYWNNYELRGFHLLGGAKVNL